MNRGSALKWIEKLRITSYKFSNQISLRDDEYFSPIGILADFLDPNGWQIDGLGMDTFHGSHHYIPDHLLKKAKIKDREFYHQAPRFSLYDVNLNSFKNYSNYIERYYEQF